MSKLWQDITIKENAKILRAVEVIDSGGVQIALVVDKSGKLVGTVTDGDVRRAVLKNIGFDEPVSKIMFTKPAVGGKDTTVAQALAIMHQKMIHQLPIVDDEGKLIGLRLSETLYESRIENEVVLMAGGFGKRLNEMTENCPKPMLQVAGKPILETIIEQFVEAGFYKFTISLGYLGHMISDYFGDGAKWGVEIKYVTETEPLGTAGALSLLAKKPKLPFMVMNGDLLTQVDLKRLLKFHQRHDTEATMCVRGFRQSIPYGVVEIQGDVITKLEEKPVQSVLVNAGIYVLSPKCLDYIPSNKFYNMTTLFEELIAAGKKPAAFPVHEYWMDIGRKEDFDKATSDGLKEKMPELNDNILCLIAGRAGSKRLPNKNLLPLGRKTLAAHSVAQAFETGLFNDIAISSDSTAIVAAGQKAGANILIYRPPELATDEATSYDVIKHAVIEAQTKTGKDYDAVVFLQITSPLRLPEDIIKAVECFKLQKPKTLLSVSLQKNIIGVVGDAKQINGSIYIWDKKAFLAENKYIYDDTKFLVMPLHRSVDIDYRHDYEIAKFLYESGLYKEGESRII